MKRTEPLSIRQLIDQVLDQDDVRDAARVQRLCYIWPEVVGPGINQYTIKRYVIGTILHVHLSSAPLKHELQFHRQRLVEQLNKEVGANVITDIHFH